MADLRRIGATLGWLLLRGVEAVLALGVLFVVWILTDFATRPETASSEGAGTIGLALLFGWVTTAGLLALVAGGHALVGGARLASDDGFDAIVDTLPRLAVEAVVGLAVLALSPLADVFSGGFLALVGGSYVLGVLVLLHVAVDLFGAVRSALSASSSAS